MSEIREIELVFLLLLLFIIVFGLLARRLETPYPIVMVVGGLLLGLSQASHSIPILSFGRSSTSALCRCLEDFLTRF